MTHLEIKYLNTNNEASKTILNAIYYNKTIKVLKVLGSVVFAHKNENLRKPFGYMVWNALCEIIYDSRNLYYVDISNTSFEAKNFGLSKMRMNDRRNLMYLNIKDCGREFVHYISCFESKNIKFINDANMNIYIQNNESKQKEYHQQEILNNPSKVLQDIKRESNH